MPCGCSIHAHRFYIGTAIFQSPAMVGFVVHFRLRAVAEVHRIATAAAGKAYHCYQQQLLHYRSGCFFPGPVKHPAGEYGDEEDSHRKYRYADICSVAAEEFAGLPFGKKMFVQR